jgi:hypothetical protein
MRREILILNFFDTHSFRHVLASPDAPFDLKRGVRFTRMCLSRLPAEAMIRYFWSAIEGTGRSEHFSERMRIAGFTTFEDLIGPARELFRNLNDDAIPR